MKVKLTYFKPSGKYYSSGEYESSEESYNIPCEVRSMQLSGKLPGLCEGGGREFTILINTPEAKTDVPHLVSPVENWIKNG